MAIDARLEACRTDSPIIRLVTTTKAQIVKENGPDKEHYGHPEEPVDKLVLENEIVLLLASYE